MCPERSKDKIQRNYTIFKSLILVYFQAQLQYSLISSRITINSLSAFAWASSSRLLLLATQEILSYTPWIMYFHCCHLWCVQFHAWWEVVCPSLWLMLIGFKCQRSKEPQRLERFIQVSIQWEGLSVWICWTVKPEEEEQRSCGESDESIQFYPWILISLMFLTGFRTLLSAHYSST